MPLKLNVGLSKKVGLPDYGSLGATCNVEIELDGSLVSQDLDTFHRHVRNAYVACRQAVNDELARNRDGGSKNGNGASEGSDKATNGNGRGGRRASDKQLGYARTLAGQIDGFGVSRLDTLAQKMFSSPVAELSSLDASGLIDTLRDIKDGKIELDAALS